MPTCLEYSPVVGEQAVAEHEPAALVALQVVGPFKEPAFAGVHARQLQPRKRRGRQTLDQLVHAPSGARFPGGTEAPQRAPGALSAAAPLANCVRASCAAHAPLLMLLLACSCFRQAADPSCSLNCWRNRKNPLSAVMESNKRLGRIKKEDN